MATHAESIRAARSDSRVDSDDVVDDGCAEVCSNNQQRTAEKKRK